MQSNLLTFVGLHPLIGFGLQGVRALVKSMVLRRAASAPPRGVGGFAEWSRALDEGRRGALTCSPTSSSPIAARSPAGSSAPRGGMGIRSIAMHTPADRGALFTRLADEAHEIGEGANGYLDQDAIIALARKVGAECLHPGYGFLSENADFAEACGRAGVVFVGPPPQAMRTMGLKSSAKALMQRAGVPVVPGYHGDNQNPKFLREKAYEIGYPVLIKAIAGGGGRGMRRVDAHVEFDAALESASREAEARVRRRAGADREIHRLAPPYRIAGVRRRAWGLRPSLRARLLGPAPPSEGDRGMPGPGTARGDARRHGEGRDRGGAGRGLRRRGHGRIHRRPLARPQARATFTSSR